MEMTPGDINRILAENPAAIAHLETELVKARKDLEMALLERDIVSSHIRLSDEVKTLLKGKELRNADDVKAHILNHNDYQVVAIKVVNCKAVVAEIQSKVNHLEREWVSARKQASIQESERRTNTR